MDDIELFVVSSNVRSDFMSHFLPSMCNYVNIHSSSAHNTPCTLSINTTNFTETPTTNDHDGRPQQQASAPKKTFMTATH
jgi:hypothetical protein